MRVNEAIFDWTGPLGLPDFAAFQRTDLEPAFEHALLEHRSEIDAISEQPESATFANTVAALEASGRKLARVSGIFWNLVGADADPQLQTLQTTIAPKLSRHASRTAADRRLFARLDALWDQVETLDLSEEQRRVLERGHKGFVRGGAKLEPDAQSELADILARLSELGTQFGQNLLADERDWSLSVDDASVLAALPASLVSAMRNAAEERGVDGHVVTTSRALMTPFLQSCPVRELRESAFDGWTSRGARGGASDNRAIILEILRLRERRANLLGFDDFASFKLSDQMAGTPAAVRELLETVWERAVPAAVREREELAERAREEGANHVIRPWDWSYYAEKIRSSRFDIDPAAIKQHLQLDKLIDAAFKVAGRLFKLRFEERKVHCYHPDVRVWEVLNASGERQAVFVGDYFARPSKRSGAWMSAMKGQHGTFADQVEQTPVIVNVMNFAKASGSAPTLLSFDDARTLFHEFGHALHGMLSNVTYPSVAGTAVARDFVELPSQLYEHWLTVSEVLSEHAVHVDTGESMPSEMVRTVLNMETFNAGFDAVEFTASALVDLAFHTVGAKTIDDVDHFEQKTLRSLKMPEGMTMRHRSPHFAHIFTGDGYSAGYYSYMWSEVLDADAFAAFEEVSDPFDPDLADRLRTEILERGASRPEQASYLAFRGAMPSPAALLRNRGLLN